ncbi:Crp/Fnr family transcriptional regulator [Octadecabacter sp. R77987]|uniref:Crp/Fnr family transcriptional regulator n=1 Tax=Octadecabacter sp. R77987 TaxID=3093874 RepID=UPI003670600A
MIRKFIATKGKVIFQAGQECPGFVILSEGTIKVTLSGTSGREVVLYRVNPGEICLQTFSCLIDAKNYSAEGVAETDLEGELIPADQFKTRLADDAAFRNRIMASVAARFSDYQSLVEEVALTRFDARLARTLLRLADGAGVVALSHSALATETASGRAYVTRRLSEFVQQGLVEQLPKGVAILDESALRQVAADRR